MISLTTVKGFIEDGSVRVSAIGLATWNDFSQKVPNIEFAEVVYKSSEEVLNYLNT